MSIDLTYMIRNFPELVHMIINYLDPFVDYRFVLLVNKYYYQTITSNEIYPEMKKFSENNDQFDITLNMCRKIKKIHNDSHDKFESKLRLELKHSCYREEIKITRNKISKNTHLNDSNQSQNYPYIQIASGSSGLCFNYHDYYLWCAKKREQKSNLIQKYKSETIFIKLCKFEFPIISKLYFHRNETKLIKFLTYAFILACSNGQFETAKWIYHTSVSKNQRINTHICDEYIFIKSCAHGHIDVIKWLIDLNNKHNSTINIRTNNDIAFKKCCRKKHLELANYLCSLCESYKIITVIDGEILYEIMD